MPPVTQASSSKMKVKATKPKGAPEKSKAAVTDIDSIFSKPAKPTKSSASASAVATVKGKEKASSGPSKAAPNDGSVSTPKDKASETTTRPKKKSSTKADSEQRSGVEKGESSRVVEVVDPSIPRPKAAEVVAAPTTTKDKGKKRDKKEAEEDEMFADSRGTGPRRKTEEGFLIYKEAELDIDPEAGGTPLCPFDCECCF